MTKKSSSSQSKKASEASLSTTQETRRDFLYLTTAAFGLTGLAATAWPFINTLNPSADVRALSVVKVDISGVEVGKSMTVNWQGKPVYIRRRTPEEIKQAEEVTLNELIDPEEDKVRVQKSEWLVVLGICTHLGCRPVGQKAMDQKGEYGGWLCPCHGSHYDTSGRIRKGPAPKNLPVPPYEFINDTQIKIG